MGSPMLLQVPAEGSRREKGTHGRQCSPAWCIIILVIFQDAVLASRFL